MKTEYVVLKGEEKEGEVLKKAAAILNHGGLVAFPTETVYGLGGDGLNPSSSKKIYEAKGRPSDNPLILHVSEVSEIDRLVKEIPKTAKILSDTFWPGPMTLVMKKSELVPFETTGGLDTVAIRIPKNEIARKLIQEAGCPIAAPSANASGRPSPTKGSHVKEDMDGKIEMILDGGEVGIGLESTIIDVTGEIPVILRPGFITKEMLSQLLLEVEEDETIKNPERQKDVKPKAPGMKYRHYAPKGEMTIFEGERKRVVEAINKEILKEKEKKRAIAILATEETKADYIGADYVLSVGSYKNLSQIAHNLFHTLRSFDELGAELIFSESFLEGELSGAIMNRLRKAAGHKVRKID